MGTFADYSGEMTIPPNLRKEFTERMMKILHYGGMMNINKVDMFNSEIYLLSPLTLSKNNDVAFYYNYFEDDSWESAGYNAKKCVAHLIIAISWELADIGKKHKQKANDNYKKNHGRIIIESSDCLSRPLCNSFAPWQNTVLDHYCHIIKGYGYHTGNF